MPLALELAAARAAVLSPAAILERLRTSSEPLGPGRRDAPERHRTLHATIDWTYQLLTPAEQTLFAQLGLFVGGFTAHSAEAVCAGVSHSVVDGLASLLDHSLIHPVTTPRDRRLAMLEPIRDYALSRLLQDAGHEHAIVRHAAHYVAVAEAAQAGLKSSDQLQWLDTLDDEQANLRAVQHANSQLQLDLALQIAGALRDYWVTRDLVPEIRAWLSQALAKPPGANATRVRALLALGVAACEDAARTQATLALEQCLRMCPEVDDVTLTVLSEAELAYSERNQGRIQTAASCSERALALARETEDPWTRAHVLFLAASCARDYETARDLELEALALFRWLGDRIWPALVESNLGYHATVAGDFREARLRLEQPIIDADAVWGAGLKAQIQGNLGLLDLLEGRDAHAGAHLSQALAALRRTGERAGTREALTGLAALSVKAGKLDRAARLAVAADALYDGPRSPGEELLHDRYLHPLQPPTGHPPSRPPLGAAALDTILSEASQHYVAQARTEPTGTPP